VAAQIFNFHLKKTLKQITIHIVFIKIVFDKNYKLAMLRYFVPH